MKITICAHDIIERALWDNYEYYVLSRKKEKYDIRKIISENKEFEISETDALIIGLLKCIETDNLIHRFNEHVQYQLSIKSSQVIKDINSFFIKKKIIIDLIHNFKRKFPQEWDPKANYKESLSKLFLYLKEIESKVNMIDIREITDKYGTHEYIQSNRVKKTLNFHK